MEKKYTLEHVVELCKQFDETEDSSYLASAFFDAKNSENKTCSKYGLWLVYYIAIHHQLEEKLKKVIKQKETKNV